MEYPTVLRAGADKNAVDPGYHNYTALHWSAENGHRNVVIKLLHTQRGVRCL